MESLPEVTIYPISVNEINIDFSSIPENTSFAYYINGAEIETINLTEKTYTFEYNFVNAIEIVVSNGVDEESITINPGEVRSEISLLGDNHAYLIENNLYINGELQSGEYVNVYEGYALSSSGHVLNISSKEVLNSITEENSNILSEQTIETSNTENIEKGLIETILEKSAKPLHTYEYKGSYIETFGTYSKVNGNVKLQIYNVRSGKLSAISSNLDMKIDNYVVDNYNDKEYQTILTNSGEIVDLKEQLQYPDNFLSRNIKQIVQNSHHENTEMMVIYNTGKVIIFNYVNGNVIYETEEKADSGLTDYITGSINSIWSDYEDKQSEYLRSKELIAKLAEMPIEEVLKGVEDNTNNVNVDDSTGIITNLNNSAGGAANPNHSAENINNINPNNGNLSNSNITNNTTSTNEESYITVYNGETGEYEVYSESEILEGKEEMPVSETEKIKSNGLESVYNYDKEEETGIQINGSIIVIIIITLIIISLIILKIIILKKKK